MTIINIAFHSQGIPFSFYTFDLLKGTERFLFITELAYIYVISLTFTSYSTFFIPLYLTLELSSIPSPFAVERIKEASARVYLSPSTLPHSVKAFNKGVATQATIALV
jgi:hypothetical protein